MCATFNKVNISATYKWKGDICATYSNNVIFVPPVVRMWYLSQQ